MVSSKMTKKTKIPEYAVKARKFFRNSQMEKARKLRREESGESGATFGIYRSVRLEEIAKDLDMFLENKKEYKRRFRRIAAVSGDAASPEHFPEEVKKEIDFSRKILRDVNRREEERAKEAADVLLKAARHRDIFPSMRFFLGDTASKCLKAVGTAYYQRVILK